MERWKGRVALVTGASMGIGAAIAGDLVKNGMVVVGCARHVEDIQKTAEDLASEAGHLIPMKCNLAKIEDIESMFRAITEQVGGVDVCINNAAVASVESTLISGPPSEFKTVYDVNLLAATTVAHLSIKSMKERNVNDGHIINISSSMGHTVLEYGNLHTYSATKHALNAITEGLRHELRNENSTIRTTVICPSLVQTGSTQDFLLEKALQVPEKAGFLLLITT
ncbi:dehydrogenase/reductase SDR family member 11-like [Lingula anatina]|uniref:Dehydrogenase/reductase SDR family member 11-like n=1 Tax=Lingula anatina TaxID=7574 RepID=A0A2R2MR49_LINAN|nr:dehydrogenase/reductase SDR family member 11-like [Lingula anatina]|eukprot:XP_023932623.1 dehydrogenase/reductase SDR family member 11-like [Lingula anatina]